MKKYLKYLSFLAIILCFSISKVYASTVEQTNNIKTIAELEFDTIIENDTDIIQIEQVDTNKVKVTINGDNYTYTFPYDIKDQYNHYRYTYIVNERTNGKYYIKFNYINYRNEWGWGSSGEENVLYYGYMTTTENTLIENDGIISTQPMYYMSTCKLRDNNTCGSNYYYTNESYTIIYTKNSGTFETQTISYPEGTEYKLIYNNTTQLICKNGSCGSGANWYNTELYNKYSFTGQETIQYNEKYNISYTKEIKSIDIYQNALLVGQENWRITIQQAIIQNPIFKYYGKKCENTTCYWEEVNTTIANTTNINTTIDTNKTTIEFETNINTNTYTIIKLAIEINTTETIDIVIENKNNTDINIDINTIGKEYNIDTFIANTNTGILVNGKNNNTNFRTYTKRDTPFKDITYYKYHKNENMVKEDLESNIFKLGIARTDNTIYGSTKLDTYYYLQTTTLEIGQNSDNSLYILLLPYQESDNIYYIYYNTEVYYTKSNNLTFTIDYNNTQETTTLNVDNAYITNNYNNITNINLSDIEQIVLEYEQYKNDWIELWESIYNPLPNIIKHIMILLYTAALTYGIFLIWKD